MRFRSDVFLQSCGDIRIGRQMHFSDEPARHLPFLVFHDGWESSKGNEASTEGDQAMCERFTFTGTHSRAVIGILREDFFTIIL